MTRKKLLYGLLEINLSCIVIIAYYYIVAQSPARFLSASPHPLIILAAVIGLRYGNYIGILGAVICTAYYGYVYTDQVGKFLTILDNFNYYKYLLSIFWAALILGIFRDNYDIVTLRLNNRLLLLETGLEKLSRRYEESLAVNKDLKKQIIGAEHSILSLYEIASRLDSLDPEDVYTDTMGILKKFINARTVSLFIVDKKNQDLLRLKIRMGNPISKDIRTVDVLKSEGFKRVVQGRETLKWNDTDDADFPLMSAPILLNDQVVAIINIEDMDFDVLSEYAFNLFKVIVEWVSKSLAQALYVDQQIHEDRYIEQTQFLQHKAFETRLEQEKRRQAEFELDYLLLKYKLDDIRFEDVHDKITRVLRSVDVYSFIEEEQTILVLLPATPLSAVEMINERIMKNLEYKVSQIQTDLQ